MYVQPPGRTPPPDWQIPENYSGNAFQSDPPPPAAKAEIEESAPQAPKETEPPSRDTAGENADIPVGRFDAPRQGRGDRSPLSRIPLLSSLLPPSSGRKSQTALPEWALIGALVLLLFGVGEDTDILPFLLLLLLWE